MMISEEALYAAAPEAAEKFLSALPDREDCVHDFSPDFEARMATLLRRQRRRRHWRALLAAAAVLGALAAGLSVGHTTTRPFQDAQLRCVPEGFILVRGSTSEIRGERSLAYRRGADASFTLMQTQGEDLVGSKGTACQGSEVEVNGRLGLLVEEETDSTEKDLLWTDGPYIFALHGKGLSAEELLEIARNVTW